MATVWTLNANLCPVPIIPAALLSIVGGVPNVASVVVPGAQGAGSLSTPFDQNAVRIDALGRAGAGAYAIDWDSNPASAVLPGLDLTVSSGLTLAIAAGQAVLDSVVQKLAPTTLVLTDNIARTYLYIGQGGTISQVMNSLTPPGGVQAFIGSVTTLAGAITQIDGSGILSFRGSHLWRKTADDSCPTDTPPAGLSFFNECPGGIWLWNGTSYQMLTNSGRAALSFSSDANKTLTVAEYSNAMLDFLTGVGTALTATRDVILPLTPAGRTWDVRNNSNGAQILRFIGATGTGISVGTGKVARIAADATNIIRLTADL